MAMFTWRHGRSKEDAVAAIKAALREAGHEGSVTWSGTSAEARYGPFASVVHLRGEVTEEAVVIEKCGGLVGGTVLERLRELLARLFPGGGGTTFARPTPAQPQVAVVVPSEGTPAATVANPAPQLTPRQNIGCGITLVLLMVASLVAWYFQSSPLAVARQHVSEQQGVSPEALELVGYDRNDFLFFGALFSEMTVEFRVKGAEPGKRRVVELRRYIYFLPWMLHALKEKSEK
jgi:hypothetical protein